MALRIDSVPLTNPDAQMLMDAMTVDVSAIYGTHPGHITITPEPFTPPTGQFVVAYLDEAPVGCAGLRRVDDRTAQLHRVFVREEARGQGVAAAMMRALEDFAASAGYTTLRLETGYKQLAAMRMYEGLGYASIPAFPPYQDDPISRCYAKTIG